MLVIPVPVFSAKLRERGFNQAELIAQTALRLLPSRDRYTLQKDVLERSRDTQSQTGLSPHQRRQNLRGAFRVKDRDKISVRDVLLVDAVLQRGVTQDFLIRRLLENDPRSLRLAVLLDKSQERKVDLQADYFGFRAASNDHVVGYGLPGNAGARRNLPYVAGAGQAGRQGRTAGRRGARNSRRIN